MVLYGVIVWDDYGDNNWVYPRLYRTRERAWRYIEARVNNHYYLPAFDERDIRQSENELTLFNEGEIMARYEIREFIVD